MNIEHKCIYGELKFSGLHGAHFTIEHLIPVSKGGVDDLSNVNVLFSPWFY
ncbi:HNH endonuclease [Arachidicoccus ginsenosidivorans]|uniref:HNH endonuclease n=1 Tax=Arachidicoccus ginsenosidivorans TaxID=496057 RepID=A0A5B8VMU0_9BACT|nr:HNH endonuclease [Arachidicoccus ginsenosidivorans]QEC72659.1 HNH endonuclease [Arachidicoccus ginsenosidivorans]